MTDKMCCRYLFSINLSRFALFLKQNNNVESALTSCSAEHWITSCDAKYILLFFSILIQESIKCMQSNACHLYVTSSFTHIIAIRMIFVSYLHVILKVFFKMKKIISFYGHKAVFIWFNQNCMRTFANIVQYVHRPPDMYSCQKQNRNV